MTLLQRTPSSLYLGRLRRLYHNQHGRLTIGIRREDPQRIWERRCPLTPEAVHRLIKDEDVDVLVQPCERRVWRMEELVEAGARPHPTLRPAHIVLGIKETPIPELKALTDPVPLSGHQDPVARTHLMFSHTHKGQPYNMVLLDQFLSRDNQTKPRLIDYELLTDEQGKRTVGFGWFAGVAGALESLSALAHALLELGIASPFLSTPRPHTYPSLDSVLGDLRKLVSDRIASEGTPRSLGPVVICVTGTGKVARGALDLLEHLPSEKVRVEDLPALVANPDTDLHKVYVVHALPQDYFVRRGGQAYEREHYYAQPDAYESVFQTKVAPYITLLLHGAGWAKGYPRLMTNAQLATALEAARTNGHGVGRFACVGDISCDVEGGLEFLPRHSTLSDPFFRTRPPSLPAHLPDVTMMAVDILPTALPREASEHFSSVLRPYLREVIRGYRQFADEKDGGDRGMEEALERATVASAGRLRDPHVWLQGPLETWRQETAAAYAATATAKAQGELRKKRVLMLGSGMVAGPAIDELVRKGDVHLTVASNVLQEAERLTKEHENASAVFVDMSDRESVSRLVEQADLVVSLLPVPFHPGVAELCIEHRKHLVTASYISPAMRALDDRAAAADVLLLNEIGLDPGIDHCSAIALLSSLHAQGKHVRSFTSFCGGLPAPEHAEGLPLRYKFSWSPRGVLSAALNGARFKLWDKVHEIEGQDILKDVFPTLPASDVLKLEGIANRDSLPYAEEYALGELDSLRTVLRGTIRYPGFASLMHAFKALGLLQTDVQIAPRAWTDLARSALQAFLQRPIPPASDLSAFLPSECANDELVNALSWLGIAPAGLGASPSEPLSIPLPTQPAAPIDLFAAVLAHKLRYLPGERDLVVLHHEIVASVTAGLGAEEVYSSSLVTYGTPRASAMARTVGLPLALAARVVLDGGVRARGVHGPGVEDAVWRGVLRGLEEVGLGMRESVRRVAKGGVVERALVEGLRL